MKMRLPRLNARQESVFAVAVTVAAALLLIDGWLLPAYDGWQAAKVGLRREQEAHIRLSANVARGQEVNAAYTELPPEARQLDSDEATLSQLMASLEGSSGTDRVLSGTKLLSIKQEGSVKVYRLSISVSGSLPEVVRFVHEMMSGPAALGLDGFTLRGVRAGNAVECVLSVRMVRLCEPAGSGNSRQIAPTGSAKEVARS